MSRCDLRTSGFHTLSRQVSRSVREIFKRHTDLIEPLSLDEAYLDVTENKTGLATATLVARTIREQIRQELNLTASAGVAPNKFLAKLASDWRKPDGLFVIQPEDIDAFLLPLPVGRLPGVGKVTGEKLAKLGAQTVRDLRTLDLPVLEQHFGRYGQRLHELALGIDHNQVVPDRPTQSISVEDTFEHDVLLAETEPMIRRLAEKLWSASRKESRMARTVVLKLKTSEFKILTRSHTPGSPPSSCEELTDIALKLRERVDLGPQQRYRLVGVGLSNFRNPKTLLRSRSFSSSTNMETIPIAGAEIYYDKNFLPAEEATSPPTLISHRSWRNRITFFSKQARMHRPPPPGNPLESFATHEREFLYQPRSGQSRSACHKLFPPSFSAVVASRLARRGS